LLFAIFIDYITLEATRTNGCNGLKLVTGTENVLSGLNGAGFIDDILELFNCIGIKTSRET